MPIPKRVFAFIEKSSLSCEPIAHKVVYTAYDMAQTLKAPLASIAKPLVLKGPKGLVLAILSAAQSIDLSRAASALGAKSVSLPAERIVMSALKLNKKLGIAPFGRFYGIPVLLEKTFALQKKAVFPTGSFTDSIRMAMKDFVKSESPLIAHFGIAKKIKSAMRKKKKAVKKKTIRARK